jgi:hypothetical protein
MRSGRECVLARGHNKLSAHCVRTIVWWLRIAEVLLPSSRSASIFSTTECGGRSHVCDPCAAVPCLPAVGACLPTIAFSPAAADFSVRYTTFVLYIIN